jgi:hypothetical protein
MNVLKKLLGAFAILGVFSASVSGQVRHVELSVLAGINSHFAYGTAADYVLGQNDFPVTPAHGPLLLGLGAALRWGRFGIELEGRYTRAASVVLTDPSDGDTVAVKTLAHVSGTVSLVYSPLAGRLRPYLEAGGGLDVVLAKDATYTTRDGYVLDVPAPAPKDRFDPEVHAGAGLFLDFSRGFGLRLDGRYVWVLDSPRAVRSLQFGGGLVLGF